MNWNKLELEVLILFFILVLLIPLTLITFTLDYPNTPQTPKKSGNLYLTQYDWTTRASSFYYGGNTNFNNNSINELTFYISDSIIYNKIYIWNDEISKWAEYKIERTNSEWIKGNKDVSVFFTKEELKSLANMNNEIFVIAYSCSNFLNNWFCYDDKWQMEIIRIN